MSSFILKVIALTAMIIDHTGHALEACGVSYSVYMNFRIIGRIAFPIYMFLCAEGCRNTRSIPKYLLRLFIFALVSEIPFDLLFSNFTAGSNGIVFLEFTSQNVFMTLFLGVAAVYLYQLLNNHIGYAALLSVMPCAVAAYFLKTDYGAAGVFGIFFIYHMPDKNLRLLAVSLTVFYLYAIAYRSFDFMIGAGLSIALLNAYNGTRGRKMKWAFYAAYPVHLLILFCLVYFFRENIFDVFNRLFY